MLLALNCKILEPVDFTGAWYGADDGVLYVFEAGLIECAEQEVIILGDTIFSGAYSIAKDKVAIFVVDDHGVGEVVELYLVHKVTGDVLCESKDGNEIVWFFRNKNASVK